MPLAGLLTRGYAGGFILFEDFMGPQKAVVGSGTFDEPVPAFNFVAVKEFTSLLLADFIYDD